MNKDDATKSYFDLAAEMKKKTDDCCSKAHKDVEEATNTIVIQKDRIEALLEKLDPKGIDEPEED